MNIETVNNGGDVTVRLSGRLDSATSGELEETMKNVFSGEISSLCIDMTEVDFISSKGLRVLVNAYKNLNGKEMTLLSPNPSVLEVLRLSGLLKIFTIK